MSRFISNSTADFDYAATSNPDSSSHLSFNEMTLAPPRVNQPRGARPSNFELSSVPGPSTLAPSPLTIIPNHRTMEVSQGSGVNSPPLPTIESLEPVLGSRENAQKVLDFLASHHSSIQYPHEDFIAGPYYSSFIHLLQLINTVAANCAGGSVVDLVNDENTRLECKACHLDGSWFDGLRVVLEGYPGVFDARMKVLVEVSVVATQEAEILMRHIRYFESCVKEQDEKRRLAETELERIQKTREDLSARNFNIF